MLTLQIHVQIFKGEDQYEYQGSLLTDYEPILESNSIRHNSRGLLTRKQLSAGLLSTLISIFFFFSLSDLSPVFSVTYLTAALSPAGMRLVEYFVLFYPNLLYYLLFRTRVWNNVRPCSRLG